MRFSFLASKCPEYRALRARNPSLASIWLAGNAAVTKSPLCVIGAIIIVVTGTIIDPDLSRERSPWPPAGSLLFCAALLFGLGAGLMRYAVRKGEAVGDGPQREQTRDGKAEY
jgi:hypothetical protein